MAVSSGLPKYASCWLLSLHCTILFTSSPTHGPLLEQLRTPPPPTIYKHEISRYSTWIYIFQTKVTIWEKYIDKHIQRQQEHLRATAPSIVLSVVIKISVLNGSSRHPPCICFWNKKQTSARSSLHMEIVEVSARFGYFLEYALSSLFWCMKVCQLALLSSAVPLFSCYVHVWIISMGFFLALFVMYKCCSIAIASFR